MSYKLERGLVELTLERLGTTNLLKRERDRERVLTLARAQRAHLEMSFLYARPTATDFLKKCVKPETRDTFIVEGEFSYGLFH